MTMVTVDDVLNDAELREAVSDDLAEALESAYSRAQAGRQDSREKRDGYTLVVSPQGDIDVEIDSFKGFDNWVGDAQDLALHVGPTSDPNTGARVHELLGHDADGEPVAVPTGAAPAASAATDFEEAPSWRAGLPALHWPGWSPRLGAGDTSLTVAVADGVWAWRCDGCGAASLDADDFEPIRGDAEHRDCSCGAQAARTRAVYCDSCDTLILLRRADPDSSAASGVL